MGSDAMGRATTTEPVPVPVPVPVRTADGLTLSAFRHGGTSGPELLLVHGLGQSRLSWSRQTEGDLADRFRIVTYDLRGHGASEKPARAAAYADASLWAADLDAVIAASGLERPVIVGWSLGALVVGHYLRRYGSGRVAGVHLVGAVTRLSPELLGPSALAFGGLLGSPDLAVRSDAIAGFLATCFAAPPPESEFRRMLAFNAMVPREAHEGLRGIGDEGLDEVWAAVPHLAAVWGDRERHTGFEMSRRLLDLNPGARLSVYEGAAHAPFFECPERFNRELGEFARSCLDAPAVAA